MAKREINFVLFLALFVSIGIFVILSSYIFDFRKIVVIFKERAFFLHVSDQNKGKLNDNFSGVYEGSLKKLSDKEKNNIIASSIKFSDNILNSLLQHDYEKVYSASNNTMKGMGSESKFSEYMVSMNDIYGDLTDVRIGDYSISKDNSEVKINYCPYSSKMHKKIILTIWVRMEDELRLSGLKVSEVSW